MAAIRNTGYSFPMKHITVNLAPADIRKEGSAFDLPIAVGLLAATGDIVPTYLDKLLLLGELALDGTLRPIKGALPVAICAKEKDIKGLILPTENAQEASVVDGVKVAGADSLSEVIDILNGQIEKDIQSIDLTTYFNKQKKQALDFSDVKGQEQVKRALEVAAAGGHNVIMVGPPGSGKTMLSKRLPTILPDLTLQEALETTKIHSVSGVMPDGIGLIGVRPFRSPHHTISDAGLIGGGAVPRPGEVSLAHHGVLFLDELPEFKRSALEVLRQPLEDGQVTISRSAGKITLPSRFMLVAAMNPCPCGYLGDPSRECRCSTPQIQKYRARVSGPLLDRIDIHIEAPAVRIEELQERALGESSEAVRQRVESCRRIQFERFADSENRCNSGMSQRLIREHCRIEEDESRLLRKAMEELSLSARAYDRILKVSRTIADLANSSMIELPHLLEAIQYRNLDRSLFI